MFDTAVAEAAKEAPPGVHFMASGYLRDLLLRDVEAGGLTRGEARKGAK